MATHAFSPGDKVRCSRPKSAVSSRYDLSPDTLYTVSRCSHDGVHLTPAPLSIGYTASRFVLVRSAPEVVDTAWDNWKAIR